MPEGWGWQMLRHAIWASWAGLRYATVQAAHKLEWQRVAQIQDCHMLCFQANAVAYAAMSDTGCAGT